MKACLNEFCTKFYLSQTVYMYQCKLSSIMHVPFKAVFCNIMHLQGNLIFRGWIKYVIYWKSWCYLPRRNEVHLKYVIWRKCYTLMKGVWNLFSWFIWHNYWPVVFIIWNTFINQRSVSLLSHASIIVINMFLVEILAQYLHIVVTIYWCTIAGHA